MTNPYITNPILKAMDDFESNFPTKEQVIINVRVDTKGWDFTAYFEAKLTEFYNKAYKAGYEDCELEARASGAN